MVSSSVKSATSAALPALLLVLLTVILYFVTYQSLSAAITSIVAWNVIVKTLELNDFRHRIKKSHLQGSRYIAAFVATRLGLRDAIRDWCIIYSILYAIVAGITWKDADPNSLLVFWGVGVMIAALILAFLGLKIPHWLGHYPKSGLQVISDTSNLSESAVQSLIDGGSVTDFRYQVRIAIGTHFGKFNLLLLPFYVGLKVWWYLASVAIGCLFGYLYLYTVYISRIRFEKNKDIVALLASAYLSFQSALLFMIGMDIADESWNLNFVRHENVNFFKFVSFFSWFGLCLLLQAANHYHYYTFKGNHPRESTIRHFSEDNAEFRGSLFVESLASQDSGENAEPALETVLEDEENEFSVADGTLEEPLVSRREQYKRDGLNRSYFYQTGHFDPNNLRTSDELEDTKMSGAHPVFSRCTQNYEKIVSEESAQTQIKWYTRLWLATPVKPAFDTFMLGFKRTFSCQQKGSTYQRISPLNKIFFVLSSIVGIGLSGYALYVTIVACGATLQISTTKAKLPFVHKKLYSAPDLGPVCAFNHKGGNIRSFPTQQEAHLANYQIAHCGACGHCSNWIDLELEYSTRNTLAVQSQKCAIQSLFSGGFDGLKDCLQGPMIGGTHGFSEQCANCWAEDIVCTKKFCVFLYLQSKMTNKVGNFKVGINDITSATCEEANCEAGNPGDFVACSGATRRRMNITSGIARPDNQQCHIVDVKSWEEFFPPQTPQN